MKSTSIRCDWCGAFQERWYITYSRHWLVAYATWDGARDSWDFCDDACLNAWLAHGKHARSYVEHMRETFADVSDEDLAASRRLGADVELRRRAQREDER